MKLEEIKNVGVLIITPMRYTTFPVRWGAGS